MANKAETTFGSLEMDQRYKKLERYLKLALLKGKHSKNAHNRVQQSMPTWPSISSINADTIDSSCVTPSLQVSRIESEVLASSNNLKNMLSKKKSYNINKEAMATSSVKQYNTQQENHIDRCIMPPPTMNRVYHTSKKMQNRVYASLGCEKSASTPLNSSVQSFATNNFSLKTSKIDTASCISANTYNGKEYLNSFVAPLTSPKDMPKFERVFSRWKVLLNDQYQLIIKGTLECGKVARSKPVIRRYSTICVESIFKHKYRLDGNIIDERNELPDYIRGKFYNGFPDDWENVYQIWRSFVSQGCLVTFRWPTPITDSDDDLKSEMTDLTYTYGTGNKSNPLMNSYETAENAGRVIQPKSPNDKSSEMREKRHNDTHNSIQNGGEKNTSVKSLASNVEKDTPLAVQASNVSNEEDKQNTRTNVNPLCSPRKGNTLKDIIQEDKLNIIINNLADRNCSPKYIDKIIELFDCFDYVMSYNSGMESKSNSVVESCNTSVRSEIIPLQQILVCNKDNRVNDNKLEQRTELNSHSFDQGYGSIKNDTDPSKVGLNVKDNVNKRECNKREDSDKSESETYAGVPKVSIEWVLQAKEASRRLPKRKVKKRTIRPDQQTHAINRQHHANAKHEFAVPAAVPTANIQKNLPPDESCVSITEEEVEALENTRIRHSTASIVRKPQETTFGNHQLQRTDSDVLHSGGTAGPITQRNAHKRLPDFCQPNVFAKEGNLRDTQEKVQLQFTDIDYTTNSDAEMNVATNTRKMNESAGAKSHTDLRRNVAIAKGETNNSLSEKPRATRESRKEFIEPPTNEDTFVRSKPTIISSIPLNLNLKITKADIHRSAKLRDSDVSITDIEDKQLAYVRSMEETCKKSAPKTLVAAKPVLALNESPKTNDKKENPATPSTAANTKNESDSTDRIDPTSTIKLRTNVIGRPKKQSHEEPKVLIAWTPKVVHDSTSKSELGLTFQGKLLNEAGHIVHRNFTTEIVLRRLSPTLVETVNHKLYQLVGSLNDNKHVIPTELVKQCRHGCPAKIEQFCQTWKSLQHRGAGKVGEKLHNASMEMLSVPVSSRGRKILPPLCYWTGERITLKDNTPVYSLGNSQESSLISLNENSKNTDEKGKRQKVDSKNLPRKNSVTKQKPLPETNKASENQVPSTEVESPKAKAMNNAKKPRRFAANEKRKVAQQLTYSSTDSEEVSPRKRQRNSRSNVGTDAKIQSRHMTLRKRPKMEVSWNKTAHEGASTSKHDVVYRSPTKKPTPGHDMTYAYYRGLPQEDLLSEDQVSPI